MSTPPPARPRNRRRLLVLGLAVVLLTSVAAVVLVGRGGDHQDRADAGTPAGPPPPPLVEATWTAPEDAGAGTDAVVLSALSGADRVVVADGDDLVALDPGTGEQRWRLRGATPCEVSLVDGDEVAATVPDRTTGRGRKCDRLALLDLDAGTVSWRTRIPAAVNGGYRSLGLSRGVVTFHDRCTDRFLYRFVRATGRPLPSVVRNSYCEGAGLSGDLLVHPVEGPSGQPESVVLADADTVRERARLQGFDGVQGTDVVAVVNREPLVVDVVRRGHRVLREIDESGRTVRELGYQQDENAVGVHHLVGVADGVMVVTFDYLGRVMYGIDLATDDVLWQMGGGDVDQVVGLDGDRLVSWYPVGDEVWVTAAPVRSGDEREVLGRLAGTATPEVGLGFPNLPATTPVGLAAGQVIVAGVADGTRSYPLPDEGDGIDRDELSVQTQLQQLEQQVSTDEDAPETDPDDYTADDNRGCDDVTPAGFRQLGWGVDADLPRAARCEWSHAQWLPGNRGLWTNRVSVGSYVIGTSPASVTDGTDAGPASERAHEQVEAALTGDVVAVPGIGDEAWVTRRTYAGRTTNVWVRDRNLVVNVEVTTSDDPGAPSPARSERALLTVVGEVLRGYGLTPPRSLPSR